MNNEEVLTDIEEAISRVCGDVKKKRGPSGSTKLDSLSKLINSYSRLIDRMNTNKEEPEPFGTPVAFDGSNKSGLIR